MDEPRCIQQMWCMFEQCKQKKMHGMSLMDWDVPIYIKNLIRTYLQMSAAKNLPISSPKSQLNIKNLLKKQSCFIVN